ncbi:MAG: AAA family ATPase [Candidatus Marinarcus sp.]|uniref:AAA family ATPase n=1 Tax=Candidatus Marinarcus sp. TaxID=3100987 RepID=UPI003AFFE672
MELVYLWVEKYKNIEKQGFSFSPRFNCEYDKDKNELTIDENEDYVSIFPENINITAIVGENGSGKSNLLHELSKFRKDEKCNNTDSILFFYDDESKKLKRIKNEENKFTIILYDDNLKNTNIKSTHSTVEKNFEEALFLSTDKEQRDISFVHLANSNNIEFKDEFSFFPTHLQIIVNDKINDLFQFIDFITIDKQNIKIKDEEKKNTCEFLRKNLTIAIEKIKKRDNLIASLREYLYIRYFIYSLSRNLENHYFYKEFKQNIIEQDYKMDYQSFISFISDEKFNKSKNLTLFEKIPDVLSKNILGDGTFEINLKKDDVLDLICNLFMKLFKTNFFTELKNKRIYFNDLSSGEQHLLTFFSKLHFILDRLEMKENIYILLDEPETKLHPNWNKKLVNYLLKFIKNTRFLKNKKVIFIITTHSPFILSDLPKENVIFLKKDEKTGNCINATNKVDINPFGANIHTLLSHGFFMKDGLMGEFAKSKIDDVIKYLNNGKDTTINNDKDAQNIINIIGEPILKRELQRMLKNKMELSNKEEIDTIKEEIKELTEKLEILEGKK